MKMNFSLSQLIRPTTKITVLDIGASYMQVPRYQPLIDAGLACVIGFEPNQEQCEKLNARYGKPHQFFPYFVGDGNPASFYETNWFATGSLYKPNSKVLERYAGLAEEVTLVAEHPVNTKSLDGMVEIGDIDYIKIDVQGAELSIFKHGERLLKKAVIIQAEAEFLELYENQPLFTDVDVFLRSRGFSFHRFLNFGTRALKPLTVNKDLQSQLLWTDALYTKDLTDVQDLSEDKLIKLAIIAHDIYVLYDLSTYLLRKIDKIRGSTLVENYINLLNTSQVPPHLRQKAAE